MEILFETMKKYRFLIVGLSVFILLFVAYTLFFKRASSVPPDTLVTTSGGRSEVDAITVDLLTLLLSLKTLDLDTTIFSDDRFKSLTDFSVELIPQPVGRSNPFLPLGGGNVSTPTGNQKMLSPAR